MKITLILSVIFIFCSELYAREGIRSNRFEALTGMRKEKLRVENKSNAETALLYHYGKTPSPFLTKHFMFLPPHSRILDSNLGDGHNAVFLAMKGYSVIGVSDSSESINKAHNLARKYGVRIETHLGKIDDFKGKKFDAVLSIDDVDRAKYKELFGMLKKGAYMVIEGPVGKDKSSRRLGSQELLSLFSDVRVVYFLEMLKTKRPLSRLIISK